MRVALTCHPATPTQSVRAVRAKITRKDAALAICYSVRGELERLRIPPPRAARIADRLWEHTCCELFIGREGEPAYHELNFSPSGEWAVHAFEDYRKGALLSDEGLKPRITVRIAKAFELDALVQLDALAPRYARGPLSLGVSMVIEEAGNAAPGAFSYWALRHPPGKPDFHHPAAFAAMLE